MFELEEYTANLLDIKTRDSVESRVLNGGEKVTMFERPIQMRRAHN